MGMKSNDSYKLPSISLRLVNSCLGVSQWNLSEYIKIVIEIRYVNLSGFASDFFKLSFIDLSTARPKWRLDGPALSGHLLYSLVNHAYANRYHHHLVRNIIMERYGFHIIISIQASDA